MQMERSGLAKCVEKYPNLKAGWHSTRKFTNVSYNVMLLNPTYFASQTMITDQCKRYMADHKKLKHVQLGFAPMEVDSKSPLFIQTRPA